MTRRSRFSLMAWLHKHRLKFFIGTAVIFLGGMFAGFGSYVFVRSPRDTAFKVNGAPVTLGRFQQTVDQMALVAGREKSLGEGDLAGIRQAALQDLVKQEVFWQEANRHGIRVVDEELRSYVESLPAFQREGRFSQEAYVRTLVSTLRMTPEEFEEARRKELAFQKFQFLLMTSVQIPKTEFKEASAWALTKVQDPREKRRIAADIKLLTDVTHRVEANELVNRWLAQVNSNLKVRVVAPELQNL